MNIAQIILSTALTAIILVQLRNSGGVGSMFGGAESAVYHTRRGIDRTLFLATIGLSVAFFVITVLNVIIAAPV